MKAYRNFQKILAMLILAILTFSIVSCSKDDDPKENSIVGEWRLSIKESDGEFWYCQYNFKTNGTFDVKDWSSDQSEPKVYEATGAYSTTESFITLKFDDDDTETYRYTLSGNKLTIYDYEEDGPNDFYRL